MNCAAIPRDLVESEMFGHERGAFTGATERRLGRFELAHTGTLLLDEVGDLGAEAQAKLLRAIEAKEIERVGGGKPIKVDVRILAATNHDLERAVKDGRFREDLYFRLNVIPLAVLPLRERPGDIPALVRHFASLQRRRSGQAAPVWSDDGRFARSHGIAGPAMFASSRTSSNGSPFCTPGSRSAKRKSPPCCPRATASPRRRSPTSSRPN